MPTTRAAFHGQAVRTVKLYPLSRRGAWPQGAGRDRTQVDTAQLAEPDELRHQCRRDQRVTGGGEVDAVTHPQDLAVLLPEEVAVRAHDRVEIDHRRYAMR